MCTTSDELMPCWSQQEFETIDLGDKRLTQRLIDVAEELLASHNPLSMLRVGIGQRQKRRIVYLIMRRLLPRQSYLLIFNELLNG